MFAAKPFDKLTTVRQLGIGLLSLLSGAGLTSACQLISGADDISFAETPTTSGTAAGGSGGSGAGGDASCERKLPPQRPEGPTSEVELDDIVLAVRSIDLDETFDSEVGPTVGYDLDGLCTCPDALGCIRPASQTSPLCDGPSSVDNSMSRLFEGFSTINASSEQLSALADAGVWTMLIRIRGYNGESDDEQVEVSLFGSDSLSSDPCYLPPGTGGGGGGRGADSPQWDGSDRWPVDRDAFLAPAGSGGGGGGSSCPPDVTAPAYDQGRYTDANAYVHDGVLVASSDGASFLIQGNTFRMDFALGRGGFFTAKLDQIARGDRQLWRLSEGVFAGRLEDDALFRMLTQIQTGMMTICPGTDLYSFISVQVCNNLDISAFGGPTSSCNAMSYGFGFEAEQAQMGSMIDLAPNPPCPIDPPPGQCDED